MGSLPRNRKFMKEVKSQCCWDVMSTFLKSPQNTRLGRESQALWENGLTKNTLKCHRGCTKNESWTDGSADAALAEQA